MNRSADWRGRRGIFGKIEENDWKAKENKGNNPFNVLFNNLILRLLPAPVTWQYGLLVSELANVAGDFEKKVFREKLLLVKR